MADTATGLSRWSAIPLGVLVKRSNSGKDDGRNNSTIPRDRDLDRGDTATAEKKPKGPADPCIGRKD